MINLRPEELDRLKLLFSELNPQKPSALPKRTLTMQEKIFTLNILRENFPNLFSGLTEEQLKDNNFLLKHLSNPYNRHKIRDTLRKELSKLSVAQQNELAEILEEEPVGTERIAVQSTGEAPQAGQEPIPSTSKSMPGGIPAMPTAPYISTPRIFRNVPQAPETPKPDIAIANKSGYVAEKPPSEFHVTDKSGNITGTYSKEPLSVPAQGVEPQPKIFVANSSGIVTGEHKISPAPTPTPTTPISSPKRLNFSSFKSSISSGFKNAQNFIASKANIPTRNLLKGIGENAKGMFKGLGGGAAQTGSRALGGLTNMANSRNFGGIGSNNIFGRLSRIGKGRNISKATSAGKTKSRTGLKVALGLLGFIIIVGGISAISQTPQPGEASPISGGGYAGADIANCKFTRNGNSLPIKSSTLVSYINQAAASSGIPAQILASIAMHENASFVANRTNADPEIQANSSCSPGNLFCEKNGLVLHSITGEDSPCTQEEIDNGAKTAQAKGLMQNLDIYNQGKDLCSITGSLTIAAAKLKADGITSAPTEKQVENAILAYYNDCTYPGGNYCTEVWQDLQNCQAPAVVGGGGGGVAPALATDCPIPNGTISCGSFATPIQTADGLCGHCSIGYGAANTQAYCNPYPGTKYGIDIDGKGGQAIYLPKINGNIITWKFREEEPGTTQSILKYTGVLNDGFAYQTYYLQLHHTQPGSSNTGAQQSGDLGGKICSSGCNHVHIQIGNGGDNQNNTGWLDAAQYFCKK